MRAAVDRLDNDIMAIGIFIGQAALDDAADKGASIGRGRVIDDLIDQRGRVPARRIGALHGADNVAALAHAAQRVCKVGGEPPRSEEHTSELQSLMRISYAVFCLKKKKNINKNATI